MNRYARLVRMLLREAMVDSATNPLTNMLSECCRYDEYEVVEEVVMAALLDGLARPGTPLRLPEDAPESAHLSRLAGAVQVAAVRFLQHAVAEVMAPGLDLLWDGKPVFEHGRLFLAGRVLGKWRDQAADNCPQLSILTAFQARRWPRWVPNEMDSEEQARNACKNLNRKVGSHLHFAASFDRITWVRGGNDT
ncbi:MAG: hypothetical protein K2V38_12235 [Gemmataceae bacterium]|nr:hypothetical protein [Gemmataceae bacterium]